MNKRADNVKYRKQCLHLLPDVHNGNKTDDKATIDEAKFNFYDNTKNIIV